MSEVYASTEELNHLFGVKTMDNEINEFLDRNPQLNKFVKYLKETYGLVIDKEVKGSVYLSYGNGIDVCNVTYSADIWNKRVNRFAEEYRIQSRFFPTTTRSTKDFRESTSLIGIKNAIKKVGLPSIEQINRIVFAKLDNVKDLIVLKGKTSDTYKSRYDLSVDIIQSMMSTVVTGVPIADLEIVKKIKTILTKWENIDTLSTSRSVIIEEFYKGGVHVIGAMANDTYIHGIVKLQEGEIKGLDIPLYVMEQEFRKIDNLEDYPELVGITTMLKVRNEGLGKSLTRGFIPVSDNSTYDADMDVLYIAGNNCTIMGDILWAVVGV